LEFTMRLSRFAAALTAGLLPLGLFAQTPAHAMTDGATPDEAHPAVVALLIVTDFYTTEEEAGGATEQATMYCSGMLISPKVVLTASHCNAIEDEQWFKDGHYTLGVTNVQDLGLPEDGYQWFPYDPVLDASQSDVVEAVTNPLYKGRYREDVSVQLINESDPLNVKAGGYGVLPPVGLLDRLKQERALRGLPMLVLGYGSEAKVIPANAGPTFPDSGERRSASLPTIALDKQWIHQDQNVGRNPAQAGACYGDSGGPSLLTVAGTTYVVGVTSTGDGPCFATNVASRVDTPSALAFLGQFL
jgi:hypothetical protein